MNNKTDTASRAVRYNIQTYRDTYITLNATSANMTARVLAILSLLLVVTQLTEAGKQHTE